MLLSLGGVGRREGERERDNDYDYDEIKEYFQQAADQGLAEIVQLNVGAIEINQAGIELTS